MHAHQADIDYFTNHGADLNSISDANPILADQEKVPHDGDQDTLHGDRNTRRQQACKRSKGAEFGRKA